jgi:hypothetical protein
MTAPTIKRGYTKNTMKGTKDTKDFVFLVIFFVALVLPLFS